MRSKSFDLYHDLNLLFKSLWTSSFLELFNDVSLCLNIDSLSKMLLK